MAEQEKRYDSSCLLYVRVCVCVGVALLCAGVCGCAALSASTRRRVVSHFELLLSDSYRLDVCVVAEASEQHFALRVPLEKVTVEHLHQIQPGDSVS